MGRIRGSVEPWLSTCGALGERAEVQAERWGGFLPIPHPARDLAQRSAHTAQEAPSGLYPSGAYSGAQPLFLPAAYWPLWLGVFCGFCFVCVCVFAMLEMNAEPYTGCGPATEPHFLPSFTF